MTLPHAAAYVQTGLSAAVTGMPAGTVARQEEPSLTLMPVVAAQGDVAAGNVRVQKVEAPVKVELLSKRLGGQVRFCKIFVTLRSSPERASASTARTRNGQHPGLQGRRRREPCDLEDLLLVESLPQ
jgi:hypothetical protein